MLLPTLPLCQERGLGLELLLCEWSQGHPESIPLLDSRVEKSCNKVKIFQISNWCSIGSPFSMHAKSVVVV